MNVLELFHELKAIFAESTFFSRDALHIYGGVFFYLFWISIFKNKRSVAPLVLIFLAVFINEWFDILHSLDSSGKIIWEASLVDFINTLLLPLVLYIFLKYQSR